jgi:hypothetical protein
MLDTGCVCEKVLQLAVPVVPYFVISHTEHPDCYTGSDNSPTAKCNFFQLQFSVVYFLLNILAPMTGIGQMCILINIEV